MCGKIGGTKGGKSMAKKKGGKRMAKKKATTRRKAKSPRDLAPRKGVKGGRIASRLGIRGPIGISST